MDIARGFFLQKRPHLLKLTPSRAGVVQQVTQLARVGFDILNVFLESGVAFEDEDLVFWPTFCAYCVHGEFALSVRGICSLTSTRRNKFLRQLLGTSKIEEERITMDE